MYQGNKVRLRALDAADARLCAIWMNDRENLVNIAGGGRMPISEEEERDYILRNSYNTFGIELLDGGRLIGTCSFFEVDHQAAACKIGILIGEEQFRGKGYGGDAIVTLLKFLFLERNIYRVALDVYAYNRRAVALYERLGFVRECAYREQVYVNGRYWDKYAYAMLREEFEAKYGIG